MFRDLLRLLILLVFLVSGAAALVYEVVWMRQLSLVFGVSSFAVATVLAAFMGGLAIGSYLLGRFIDGHDHPLRVYALLEVGIGLSALCVPLAFELLRPITIWLHQQELPYALFALLRALLAGAVLLVPTVLMGGTFPVLARFFVRTREELGRGAGLLYFLNTAGAVVGTLVAGFYLIEHLGLRRTTWLAAGINLAAAAVAAGIAALGGDRKAGAAPAEASEEEPSGISTGQVRLALVCIGLSGFSSLGYEVLWSRALLRYLYNSTYAFTTMLVAFLAGIALGSALYTLLLSRSKRPMLVFAVLQLLVALGFTVAALLFVDLGSVSSVLVGEGRVESFAGALRIMFARASLVLLVPTIFLGATLPLATDVCTRGMRTLGRSIGRVYAINTLGSILGSLGTAFVLIPALGMARSLKLLIGLNLAMAAALAMTALPETARRVAVAVGSVLLVFAVHRTVPGDLFVRTLIPTFGAHLVFYREGATDTVGVLEYTAGPSIGQRAIVYGDQRATASTNSYPFNYFFAHLPMLLHEGEPRKVLHICFGVGNSLSAVARHDSVERIDSVDLSPHVIDAAPYFWTNENVIENPKVRSIVADGRTFVMASPETYDVILLEPPEIFTAGVINLYTREFYEDVAKRLAPGGIFQQWVPVGQSELVGDRMLFRAFQDVFPHATAWQQLTEGFILLVGSDKPLRIDYTELRRRVQQPRIRRDLELSTVRNVDHLLSFFVYDPAALAEFTVGWPPISDDRTILDFTMPHHEGSGFGFGVAAWTGRTPSSVWSLWAVKERTRYFEKSRRSVMPLLDNLGESAEAVAARIAAEASNPAREPAPIPAAAWRR